MKLQQQSQLRSKIIEWNNKFPLDREYRQKRNITFGSDEHRLIDQIDLYLQFIEDKLYEEFVDKAKKSIEKEKELEKGVWLQENTLNEETALDLFNKMNIDEIPADSPIQFED